VAKWKCQLYIFLVLVFYIEDAESAVAKENTFTATAQVTQVYDDNFFKTNADAIALNPLLIGVDREEIISAYSVSSLIDWNYSKQNFIVDLEITRNEFSNNPAFDNTSKDLNATWGWQLGHFFQGKIRSGYTTSLASFVDNQSLALEGAERKERKHLFEGEWLPSSAISTKLTFTKIELDYSGTEITINEREADVVTLGIYYRKADDSEFGVKVINNHTVFPNRTFEANSSIDSGFDLTTYVIETKLNVSYKSDFSGRFGWETLKNENLNERDYSDWSFRLAYNWQATEKLLISMNVKNEVSPSQSLIATYRRSQILALNAYFNINGKNRLSVAAEMEERKLIADNTLEDLQGDIIEDNMSLTANWSFQPFVHFMTDVGYQLSERDSSLNSRDFDSRVFYISAKATW